MSSIWKTLGLDGPTADNKIIRRAYAKALKHTRPDEDPEGFMALRDAFERAKLYASYHADFDAPTADDPPALALNTGQDTIESALIDADNTPPITTADYLPDELEPAVPILPPIELSDVPDEGEDVATPPEPEEEQLFVILEASVALLESDNRNSEPAWKRLLTQGNDLSLDDYNVFEQRLRGQLLEHFGYYDPQLKPRKGLKRFLPARKKHSKISRDTGIFIFKTMGWNRWKSYPDYVQEELLHILYELGIKERPKIEETGRKAIFTEFRYVAKAFGIAVIFALLGNYFEPPADTSPPPEPLPNSGDTKYGSYSYSEADGKWKYQLSGDHEDIKSLKPGDIFVDRFELQFSDDQITSIVITIKGTDAEPDIDNIQTTRPVKDDPPEGLHSIFFLIAGIAGIFAIIRLFGFTIGLIIGGFGFIIGWMMLLFRQIFRR